MQATTAQSFQTALQWSFGTAPEEAAQVAAQLVPCVCRGGDWLFRQGDAADCMYLLARGRMEL